MNWQRGDFAKCTKDGWADTAPPARPVAGKTYAVGGVEHRFGKRWLILPTLGAGTDLWAADCFERAAASSVSAADRVRVIPMLDQSTGQPLKNRRIRENSK